MNIENESIRANPAASPERPIRKRGIGPVRNDISIAPARRQQTKEDVLQSTAQLPLPLHDSSPAPPADSLSQSKLPGSLEQPLLSSNGPETSLEERLLEETGADSPGTPEQLDTAQLGSALVSAWADGASLQHGLHTEGAEELFPGVHDSPRLEQAPIRQAPDLARTEASPQPRVSSAIPPPHDTPDGALVAGATTPDPPDDVHVRVSFATVTAEFSLLSRVHVISVP